MFNLEDLTFAGMNVSKEVLKHHDRTFDDCTNGMSESEKRAYKLGIDNTISFLETIIESYAIPVIHVTELEEEKELSCNDVLDYYPQ